MLELGRPEIVIFDCVSHRPHDFGAFQPWGWILMDSSWTW